MTARIYHREHSFSGSSRLEAAEIFDKYEQELFTAVVAVAEKEGKHVSLVVVPTNDVFEAIMATAQRLASRRHRLRPVEQAERRRTGQAHRRRVGTTARAAATAHVSGL